MIARTAAGAPAQVALTTAEIKALDRVVSNKPGQTLTRTLVSDQERVE